MDKRIAKLLIAENQRMIQNVEMVKRNISFESHSNYVLVGLRRAGKSYLLYQRRPRDDSSGTSARGNPLLQF